MRRLRKLRSCFFVANVANVANVALRFRPRTCYYIYYIFYYPFNIKNIIELYFLYSSPSFLIEPFCLSVLPPLSLQPSSKTHAQHSQQSQHFLHAQLSQPSQPFSNTTAPNQCTGLTMHPPNLGYCPRHRRETRHPLQGGITKRDTPWGVVTADTPQKTLFFFAYSKDFLYLCSVKLKPEK